MDREPARTDNRLIVGGIKLSPELVLFSYSRHPRHQCALLPAFRTLSRQQINIFFLTRSLKAEDQSITTSFCVLQEFSTNTLAALTGLQRKDNNLLSRRGIGVVSIFPHKHNFALLGKVLTSFADSKLPVHGLCTSISALSILTDFNKVDAAIAALNQVVDLPENHSPFRQEFRIRQINP